MLQPTCGGGAFDHTVIECKAEGEGVSDFQAARPHHRCFDNPTDAENPRLRQVEDQRERRLIQSTSASLYNQLTGLFGNLRDAQLIGMTNDRGTARTTTASE